MVTAIKAQAPVSIGSLAVRFTTAEFRHVTATLARIADAKSTMPMLAHVRIRVAESGAVSLSATDLNTSVTVSGPAWLGTFGDLCVPAKQLADIVRTMAGTEVTLSASGATGMRVASGDAEMTLIGRHSQDFPKLPDATADDLRYVETSGKALAEMIDGVLSSICRDETRFHLNGILIECSGETTRMVTTDGHRLTRSTGNVSGPRIPGVILPSKPAKEIAKLLRAESGSVCSWAVSKTHLYVRCGAWTVATKLIDAQFPPYEQVIPKEHSKIATMERKPLVAALRRAKKVFRDGRGVKLSFASGKLTLTSDAPDTGTSVETMPACSQWLDEGGRCEIGINPGYLLDAIDEIDDRCVTLAMGDVLDPVLVRGTDDATTHTIAMSPHLVVIMPMRI